MEELHDDITQVSFNSMSKEAKIADLFEVFIRDMADNTFDEVLYRQINKNLFLKIFIIVPERDRIAIICRDSGFS